MTTLEQQQKEARRRFDQEFTFGGITGVVAFNREVHPHDIKSFLDTEIAKAYKLGYKLAQEEHDKTQV